jgi:hypothetical protein
MPPTDGRPPRPHLVTRELVADAHDMYNKYVKYLIVPFALAYSGNFFISSSKKSVTLEYEGQHTHWARDSGLRMQLNTTALPVSLHAGHAFAAVSLFLLLLYQKHSVVQMSTEKTRSGYLDLLNIHRWIGRVAILLVLIMDLCGLLMGKYSAWEGFTTFNLFFFAPWLFMIVGIYGCASSTLIIWHRYFGNMLLKGCIATPLARLAGSWFQQMQFEGWADSHGYYFGIGAVTVLISIWQLHDTVMVCLDSSDDDKATVVNNKKEKYS